MAAQTQRPGWYQTDIKSIPEDARALLEGYSHLRPEEVLPHVLSIRDAGFDIGAYACIGQLRFLEISIPKTLFYSRIMRRLREGATFLDAGCCFAQELRYLVVGEGIPSVQLYGVDVEPRFIELGYDLFRDRDSLRSTFTYGDLAATLDSAKNTELAHFKGRMDVVYVASVLHLWGWDDMVAAAKRLVELSCGAPGTMIVGNQLGSLDAGERAMPFGMHFRHNVQTMKAFWEQVGQETGTRWVVEAGTSFESKAVKDNKDQWWSKDDPNVCMIDFCATRE